MSLLECLVSLSLGIAVITPLMQSSSTLVMKQAQLEKAGLVEQDAIRALEIMARGIRMAGYRKINSLQDYRQRQRTAVVDFIGLERRTGWNRSNSLWVKHEPADSVEGDCLGNRAEITKKASTPSRTKNGLRHQSFFVQKAAKDPSGSLMCTSLDRQGRLQNTSLMQHIDSLHFSWVEPMAGQGQPLVAARSGVQIVLKTTLLEREFSRFVALRNSP
jgi:Tfp pilus assembly protein PilW